MSRKFFLFFLLVLQFLGLSVFLKGFFPLKKAIPGSATFRDLPPEPGSKERGYAVPALFDRMVFVLVDALRADFVFNDTRMAHTRTSIQNNNTMSFIARAHSPTVTMPRIKALMTGSIPGFVDVIFNSVSSSFQGDSLPLQLVTAGKKVVFFGDDTWLKLFPGYFTRSDGTTSFFVTDFTEVDNNVTRHLDKEMQSTDWDIMVLHYLGLDHIGHLAGPSSPLVGPKLQEMDFIIQKIHRSLIKDDKERGVKSLMVLCGDHGMSDTGSHGGASLPEVMTPLVFLSSQFDNGRGSMFSEVVVDQIDVVSTLSLMLGLPIPQNSVGHAIPGLLNLHNPRDKLRALQVNAHQLTKVLQANGHNTDSLWELEEAHRLHEQWLESWNTARDDRTILTIKSAQVAKQYTQVLKTMSDQITASLSCYDLHAMASGIAILMQVLGWLVTMECCHGISRMVSKGDVIPSLSFMFCFGACFIVVTAVHLSICSSAFASGTCSSEILCSKQPSSIVSSTVLIIFTSFSSSIIINNITKLPLFLHTVTLHARCTFSSPKRTILIGGTVVHVFSLLSSSFVEEEHQTWYFFVKTYLFITVYTSIKMSWKQKYQELDPSFVFQKRCSENNTKKRQESDMKNTVEIAECDPRSTDKMNECNLTNAKELHNDTVDQMSENYFEKRQTSSAKQEQSLNVTAEKKSCVSQERSDGCVSVLSVKQQEGKQFMEEREDSVSQENTGAIVSFYSLVLPFVCLVLLRLSRTCNQTGIKYADQPDIGDWLNIPDNKLILSITSLLSLFVIVIFAFKRGDTLTAVVQAVGLVFVYNYRVATGALWSPLATSQPITKGLTEARAAYLCSFVLVVLSGFRFLRTLKYRHDICDNHHFMVYRKLLVESVESFCAGLMVVVALVIRAHNFFILAVFVVQQWCLEMYLPRSSSTVISWSTYLIYSWFGQVAYFILGNSNSLSTIDIAAGYIGMRAHDGTVAFLLLALSTYCGPLLWLTAVVYLVVKHSTSPKQLCDGLYDVCVTYTLPQSLLLCVYTMLVYGQRYHLFVWSVFSPKLLYEMMRTLVLLVSVTIVMVTSSFIGRGQNLELHKSE